MTSNSELQSQCLPNEDDVRFFDENGYWVSPKIFSDEQLEQVIQHQEKIYRGEFETGREPICNWIEGKDNPRALRKTDNSHWSDMTIRALVMDSTIGAVAAKLMHADMIRLWHDQLLFKPGRGSGKETANVGWHQDYTYWQCCKEPSLVTAWVAFTDVDVSNGCMQVVPRSHKWGLVNANNFFEQNLEKQQQEIIVPENEKFTTVPLVMKAGQVSFHHALTIHGSGPNSTDKPRRSIAVHLMTGDTRYKSHPHGDRHFNARILAGQTGDLFAGEPWPILYPV